MAEKNDIEYLVNVLKDRFDFEGFSPLEYIKSNYENDSYRKRADTLIKGQDDDEEQLKITRWKTDMDVNLESKIEDINKVKETRNSIPKKMHLSDNAKKLKEKIANIKEGLSKGVQGNSNLDKLSRNIKNIRSGIQELVKDNPIYQKNKSRDQLTNAFFSSESILNNISAHLKNQLIKYINGANLGVNLDETYSIIKEKGERLVIRDFIENYIEVSDDKMLSDPTFFTVPGLNIVYLMEVDGGYNSHAKKKLLQAIESPKSKASLNSVLSECKLGYKRQKELEEKKSKSKSFFNKIFIGGALSVLLLAGGAINYDSIKKKIISMNSPKIEYVNSPFSFEEKGFDYSYEGVGKSKFHLLKFNLDKYAVDVNTKNENYDDNVDIINLKVVIDPAKLNTNYSTLEKISNSDTDSKMLVTYLSQSGEILLSHGDRNNKVDNVPRQRVAIGVNKSGNTMYVAKSNLGYLDLAKKMRSFGAYNASIIDNKFVFFDGAIPRSIESGAPGKVAYSLKGKTVPSVLSVFPLR